jgi:hypothetical protein
MPYFQPATVIAVYTNIYPKMKTEEKKIKKMVQKTENTDTNVLFSELNADDGKVF